MSDKIPELEIFTYSNPQTPEKQQKNNEIVLMTMPYSEAYEAQRTEEDKKQECQDIKLYNDLVMHFITYQCKCGGDNVLGLHKLIRDFDCFIMIEAQSKHEKNKMIRWINKLTPEQKRDIYSTRLNKLTPEQRDKMLDAEFK